ncbi:MAG TPA: pilus assembly protein PilM [Syntrophales bacterium]|nr:pilus assembly protein PilM [Syntrophales bacterium]
MASNQDISSTEKLLNVIRGKAKAASEEEPSYKPVARKKKASPFLSLAPTFQRPMTVGVDIGYQAVQMVKVEESSADQWRLIDFRRVPIPSAMAQGTHEFTNFLKSELGKFIGTTKGIQIWNLMSSSNVDVRFIKIPKVPRKQLENAVYWTAKRELSFEDMDTILDFEVQSDVMEQGVKKTSVMVYTAPRKEVEAAVELFSDAGYQLSGLTVAPFAVQNLFRTKWMPAYGETLACLYIGRDGARIDIYSRGSIILTRDIKTGMNSMVESLVENFIDRKRSSARDLRWGGVPSDLAITPTQAHKLIMSLDPDSPALSTDDAGHDLSEDDIFEMIRPALDRLVRQVERTFANLGGEKVNRIYISGIVNAYKPLIDYIGEQLGIESGVMDPLDPSIPYITGYTAPATASEKVSLAEAVGLALSDNARTPNLLFTYKEKGKMATVGRVNRVILISLAAVMISGLAVFAWQERVASKKKATISDLNQQLSSLNLMVDTKLILQMAAKDRTDRRLKKEYGERYMGLAVISELSALTPENIRFLKLKTTLGAKEAEKTNPPAKPGEVGVKTLEIDGLVLGERSMLEGYLSSYVLKLKGSPLFKDTTVQRSTVEMLPQNKAEGEVLHFVLNVKLQ